MIKKKIQASKADVKVMVARRPDRPLPHHFSIFFFHIHSLHRYRQRETKLSVKCATPACYLLHTALYFLIVNTIKPLLSIIVYILADCMYGVNDNLPPYSLTSCAIGACCHKRTSKWKYLLVRYRKNKYTGLEQHETSEKDFL